MKDNYVVVEPDSGFMGAVKIYTGVIYQRHLDSGMSEDKRIGVETYTTIEEAINLATEYRNSRFFKNSLIAEHIMFVCEPESRAKYIGLFKTKMGEKAHPVSSSDLGGFVSFLIHVEIVLDKNSIKRYPEFYVC
jgi:hypothetical protein